MTKLKIGYGLTYTLTSHGLTLYAVVLQLYAFTCMYVLYGSLGFFGLHKDSPKENEHINEKQINHTWHKFLKLIEIKKI